MDPSSDQNLLARLAGGGADGANPWSQLAASEPDHDDPAPGEDDGDKKLNAMLNRLNRLGSGKADSEQGAGTSPSEAETDDDNAFFPVEPGSFREAQLTDSEVEALSLKFLLARGDAAGRDIADQVKLPFVLIDELLRSMKTDQLVVHRGSAPMNDYQYELTDIGRERARRYSLHCTYFGSAPVALSDYVASVQAQSLAGQHPTPEDLHRAFEGLLLNKRMLDRLGPAINSGRGLFLHGAPGNGKTSIAERVTAAFGKNIWIPRAIGID
ncbi:MAG: AAA family ATPase, partial [Planctomycetota bacterium]